MNVNLTSPPPTQDEIERLAMNLTNQLVVWRRSTVTQSLMFCITSLLVFCLARDWPQNHPSATLAAALALGVAPAASYFMLLLTRTKIYWLEAQLALQSHPELLPYKTAIEQQGRSLTNAEVEAIVDFHRNAICIRRASATGGAK